MLTVNTLTTSALEGGAHEVGGPGPLREGWHHKQNIENDEISIIYPNFDVLVGQLLQSVWQGDYRE